MAGGERRPPMERGERLTAMEWLRKTDGGERALTASLLALSALTSLLAIGPGSCEDLSKHHAKEGNILVLSLLPRTPNGCERVVGFVGVAQWEEGLRSALRRKTQKPNIDNDNVCRPPQKNIILIKRYKKCFSCVFYTRGFQLRTRTADVRWRRTTVNDRTPPNIT